jgi:ketosteroid isomerase-like protein
MEEHPHIRSIREALEAYWRGDFDAVRTYFSPDVVWRLAGTSPLSGTYRGFEAFAELQRKLLELTAGTYRVEPVDMLAGDRFVFVFMRAAGERDGKRLDVLRAEVVRVGEDGKFEEYWSLANDQAAEDEFWS